MLGIAGLIALLVGFGGSIILEMVDQAARGVTDFKHFSNIPILATIPNIHDNAYARELLLRRAAIYGGIITFTTALTLFLLVYGDKVRNILLGAG